MADENEEVRLCDLTETREEFYDDDVVVVDSELHDTAKMLAKTSLPQNILAGRIAPPFIPSSEPNSTTTVAGRPYIYNGVQYVAKVDGYQGPWDASKFYQDSVDNVIETAFGKAKNENAGEITFAAVSGSAILVKVPVEIAPNDEFIVRVVGDVVTNALNLRSRNSWQIGDQNVETFTTITIGTWYAIKATQKADCITVDRASASTSGNITLQVIAKKALYKYLFDEQANYLYGKAKNGNAGETTVSVTSGTGISIETPMDINPGDKFLLRIVGSATTTLNVRSKLNLSNTTIESFSNLQPNVWTEITATQKADFIHAYRNSAPSSGEITLQVLPKKLLYNTIIGEIDTIENGFTESSDYDMSGASTGYYYNSSGELVYNANSSYLDLTFDGSAAGKKIVITLSNSVTTSARCFVLEDGNGNILEYVSFSMILNYNRSYTLIHAAQEGYILKCSWLTIEGAPKVSRILSHTPSIKEEIVNDTLYVSPNGNDSNDGSMPLPKKTVDGALLAGAKTVILMGGIYTDSQIKLTLSAHDKITIKGREGEKVIFKKSDSLITDSGDETAVAGYSNVWSIPLNTSPYSSNTGHCLFFDGCADVTTAINPSDAHPLEKGLYYRCDCTKSVCTTAATLSDALDEIDASDSYKWFYDSVGKVLYFNRPASTATYPLHKCSVYKYFVTVKDKSLVLSNIEFRYGIVGLTELNIAEVYNCASKYVYGAGGFVYDDSVSVLFDHCEAARVYLPGSGGDGFNGHTSGSDSTIIYSQVTLRECWSHDNNDDGYSDHDYAEATIDGGLFEYNGKGGVTPSYGSHCVAKNVLSRYNKHGFFYPGPVHEGNGGQLMCYCCVSIGHKANEGDGYVVTGAGDKMILVNCKSINDRYAFNCASGCYMDIIDCGTTESTSVYNGAGTFNKIKTTIAE